MPTPKGFESWWAFLLEQRVSHYQYFLDEVCVFWMIAENDPFTTRFRAVAKQLCVHGNLVNQMHTRTHFAACFNWSIQQTDTVDLIPFTWKQIHCVRKTKPNIETRMCSSSHIYCVASELAEKWLKHHFWMVSFILQTFSQPNIIHLGSSNLFRFITRAETQLMCRKFSHSLENKFWFACAVRNTYHNFRRIASLHLTLFPHFNVMDVVRHGCFFYLPILLLSSLLHLLWWKFICVFSCRHLSSISMKLDL